jgi:hypothetical protein
VAYRKRLKPDERIEKGEVYEFGGGAAKFTFYLWRPEDPHCCPSAGKVTGSFAIKRKKGGNLWMVPVAFKRERVRPR